MYQSLRKSVFAVLAIALGAIFVAPALVSPAQAKDGSFRHVVFHVDDNNKAKMNLALNNAANVSKYYADKGEKVKIEIVAYGPGLNMLRADTSPVTARLETFALEYENVAFAACENTLQKMAKKEGKTPPILAFDNIRMVPSGVVQLVERQVEGWQYIRP